MEKNSPGLTGLLHATSVLAVLVAVWQAAKWLFDPPDFLLPGPVDVAGVIYHQFAHIAVNALITVQEMVLGLAGFLRKTLALDPLSDLPLGAEIALQRDYLRIEETRFSDRLSVRIDVAPAAQRALVPALLLQPLIENAIRHGVARTPGRAELEIGARIEPGETLAIWVENPVPEAGGATATGLGIGLRNVGERLSACHPGHATSCAFGPAGPGRVRVELRMPFRT